MASFAKNEIDDYQFQNAMQVHLTCHHLVPQETQDNGHLAKMPLLQRCCDEASIYNRFLAVGSPKQ